MADENQTTYLGSFVIPLGLISYSFWPLHSPSKNDVGYEKSEASLQIPLADRMVSVRL